MRVAVKVIILSAIQCKVYAINTNVPKVIVNNSKEAIFFSRETIPHIRGKEKKEWLNQFTFYKHIGIYAYRTSVLKKITKLPQSALEVAEALEQLRWIQNGYKINVEFTDFESVAIDTPEDLKRLANFL